MSYIKATIIFSICSIFHGLPTTSLIPRKTEILLGRKTQNVHFNSGRCGSVGRAVASDIRSLWFTSNHGNKFMMITFTVNCLKDDDNKEKEAGNDLFSSYLSQLLEPLWNGYEVDF